MHGKCLAVPFLIMTNYGQVENAVEAMQLGAVNYLCKPVQPDRLLEAIGKVFSRPKRDGNVFYRGESYKAQEMYRQIRLVAASDISVLIRGASGTGKEHIARELHEQSRRRNKPYVTVDCGSIPEELAASEFFGHRKGSFTGADSDKAGLFHEADGGALFLDEIGNLSYRTQMLLLRALQEKCYRPVGSTRERGFDIRLISATNEDLESAIAEGRFREDLFHRLNEFTIRVPTLSECPEDILPLARSLLGHLSEEHHKRVQGFDRLAEAALRQYPWPGNIRELRNTVRRALLMAGGDWITATDLNLDLTLRQEETPGLTEEKKEKQLLLRTLEQAGNNRARAARMLDISRTTLYEKLRKYGII
jgi:two-component system response regulator HydG